MFGLACIPWGQCGDSENATALRLCASLADSWHQDIPERPYVLYLLAFKRTNVWVVAESPGSRISSFASLLYGVACRAGLSAC